MLYYSKSKKKQVDILKHIKIGHHFHWGVSQVFVKKSEHHTLSYPSLCTLHYPTHLSVKRFDLSFLAGGGYSFYPSINSNNLAMSWLKATEKNKQ